MSNRKACIVGTMLLFPGMYFWSYIFEILINQNMDWMLLPTIIVASTYLTLSAMMALGGFFSWMDEPYK